MNCPNTSRKLVWEAVRLRVGCIIGCLKVIKWQWKLIRKVIQIARNSFCLDFEGNHFDIIEADGAEYIQILQNQVDVIMVDGFDGVQIIDELVGEPFFHDCRVALRENGIFVTNWWSGDKRYPLFMQRLRTIF